MLAVEVHTIVTEWGTLRFRLTDFFQQRTVVGPHLSVKPRFDCTVISLFQLAAIFLLFVKRHWFQIKFTIGQNVTRSTVANQRLQQKHVIGGVAE